MREELSYTILSPDAISRIGEVDRTEVDLPPSSGPAPLNTNIGTGLVFGGQVTCRSAISSARSLTGSTRLG